MPSGSAGGGRSGGGKTAASGRFSDVERIDRIADQLDAAEREARHYHYNGGDIRAGTASYYDDRTGKAVSQKTVTQVKRRRNKLRKQFEKAVARAQTPRGKTASRADVKWSDSDELPF